MKNLFLVIILSLTSHSVSAQEPLRARIYQDLPGALQKPRNISRNDSTIYTRRQGIRAESRIEMIEIPFENRRPFTALSLFFHTDGPYYKDVEFRIATTRDGKRWSRPKRMNPDPEFADKYGQRNKCAMITLDPEIKAVQVYIKYNRVSKSRLKKLEYLFFVPGEGGGSIISPVGTDGSACNCELPDYTDRENWCTIGNCNPTNNPVNTNVTHLIVHHSAGSNSSNNWSAVVTAIWNDHVFGNGWSDIGYNWLIAPTGQLFQGRGFDKQGAHFCGDNGGTMGICMLGTYSNVQPNFLAIQKLTDLLAWKCCLEEFDPLSIAFHPSSNLELDRISGHRDGVCATLCPGDKLYAFLPAIRTQVQGKLNACQAVYTKQLTDISRLSPYPNPFQDAVIIKSTETDPVETLLLYDTSGRLLVQKSGTTSLQGLASLPSGPYFLLVKTANQSRFFPLTKG